MLHVQIKEIIVNKKEKQMNKLVCIFLSIFILFWTSAALAGGGTADKPIKQEWSFDGPFGTFDRQAAQRGYMVYKEVCSACHSMNLIAYRNLEEIGFSPEEIKQIASDATIMDGPNDDGEMFERPRIPADPFEAPFANKQAAMALNGGSYPPDLSLIVKARVDGPNYLYSLLTGYGKQPPADLEIDDGLYYNPYFEGGKIKMAPPLIEDAVDYADGTKTSVDQMSRDIVVFLQWAAEPEMELRKNIGMKTMVYLVFFTILFYIAKNRIWARLDSKRE